ncbi:MAG TPA: PEP-CTERM sorting domain-containing protein [Phycisphaerae bacterium]|nr:PEP-CTERM sorting domain-containing protein [Phycisphaerae bacterium]
MRKLLAVALLAAIAAPASAATLGLRFVGPNAGDDTNATVNAGESVQVEVTWEFSSASDAANGLGSISFNLTAAPENPAGGLQGDLVATTALGMDNYGTTLPNWTTGGTPGLVGAVQWAAGQNLPADAVTAAGVTVLGTFDITGLELGTHQFYIQRNITQFSPEPTTSQAISYSFNPGGDGYASQFNIGNGFAGTNTGTGAIPMTVNVTPEPAALALLALGGVAVLRRRS